MNSTETSTSTQEAAVAPQRTPVLAPKTARTTKAKHFVHKTAVKKAPPKRTTSGEAQEKTGAGRAASKKARVLDLLRRKDGATLDQIVQATGWQRPTCRGFLSIAGKSVDIVSDTKVGISRPQSGQSGVGCDQRECPTVRRY